jgi:hypothetical protein
MQPMNPASTSAESDRAGRLEHAAREVAQAVREMSHRAANTLGVPLGVLELLRERPGLTETEYQQIDLAIDRLTGLAVDLRAMHAHARQLDVAQGAPRTHSS